MIKSLQLLFVTSLTMLAIGCASTPMPPKSFNQLGQFQQVSLNANTYRVQFKAGNDLSYGHAEEIALVKSAQLTLQEGFSFFKVVDDPTNKLNQQTPRQTVVYPSRPMFAPFGGYYHPRYRNHPLYWNDPFYGYDPFFDTPYVVDVEPIEVSYTIQMFNKELAPADAFEAQRILQSLGAKYQLNADGTAKIIPIAPPHQ